MDALFGIFSLIESSLKLLSKIASSSDSSQKNGDMQQKLSAKIIEDLEGSALDCDDAIMKLKDEKPKQPFNAEIINAIKTQKSKTESYIKEMKNYQQEYNKAIKQKKPTPKIPATPFDKITDPNTVNAGNLANAYIALANARERHEMRRGTNKPEVLKPIKDRINACQNNIAALRTGSGASMEAVNHELNSIHTALTADNPTLVDSSVTTKDLALDAVNRSIMLRETALMTGDALKTNNHTIRDTLQGIKDAIEDTDDPTAIHGLSSLHREYITKAKESMTMPDEAQRNKAITDLNAMAKQDLHGITQTENQTRANKQNPTKPPLIMNNTSNNSPASKPNSNPIHQQLQKSIREKHTYIVSPVLYEGLFADKTYQVATAEFYNANPRVAKNIDKILTEMDPATSRAKNVFVEYTVKETEDDIRFKVAASIQSALELVGEPLKIDGSDETYLKIAFEHCLKNKISFDKPTSKTGLDILEKAKISFNASNVHDLVTSVEEPDYIGNMDECVRFNQSYKNKMVNMPVTTNATPSINNPTAEPLVTLSPEKCDYLKTLMDCAQESMDENNLQKNDKRGIERIKGYKTFHENEKIIYQNFLDAGTKPMPAADLQELENSIDKFVKGLGEIIKVSKQDLLESTEPVIKEANHAITKANSASRIAQASITNPNKQQTPTASLSIKNQ